ncbi:DUF2141 domain-containing protein [Skermanella pratensis]|uniref:DUF2141 domain-containing protein n=1 Tax=Skermanella pratensis TaxID=2233999 RepID=UPI00130184D1|nr:DUF2141 domain-containing protein [Skermanella pratensis]
MSRTAVLAVAAAALWAGSASASELRVTVRGVPSDAGDVKVGLYATPEAFERRERTFGEAAPARAGDVVVVFRGLAPGRYGIAAIHDINGNGKLDSNLLGVPTEPFGFGNDAKVNFAPPDFADMAVTVGAGTVETAVTLRR